MKPRTPQNKALIQNRWCNVLLRRYTKGQAPAIILHDVHGNRYYTTATISDNGRLVPAFGATATLFKTWNENEGVYEDLVAAGVITPSDHLVPYLCFQARLGFVNLKRFSK